MAPTKKKQPRERNYPLNKAGLMRLSRGRKYFQRFAWKFEKTNADAQPKPEKEKKPVLITKKFGNSEVTVRAIRLPKSYENEARPIKKPKGKPRGIVRKLRPSITPGTVLIMLAGSQKGKHVVFLKQLKSGMLLITGPYRLNGCPVRRIHPNYVIATSTHLDLSNLSVPERVNDAYFKRAPKQKKRPALGEIFDVEKEKYQVSDIQKEDQAIVDKQVMEAIKVHSEASMLKMYLKTMFSLGSGQYPHKMKF